MTSTIIIGMSFIIFVLSVLGLWFNYKKEKLEDPNAKERLAKRSLTVGAILIVLNVVNPWYNHVIQEEKYATKEDFKRLEAKYVDMKSRLYEPTQKEVESEIDKQFKAEFGNKKEIALEEYHKGLNAYENNNFVIAIDHFKTAIKIFAIPSFYLLRGNSYALTNQFDKSVADYNKIIQLNPNYAEAYNNMGIVWWEKGDYDKAIVDCNKAIQLNPNLTEAYSNRGITWWKKGDYDKALADFNKAIQLNPNFADAYNNMGIVWGEKGDYDKALADFNKAIQLNPNLAEAYSNRGIVYLLTSNKKMGCLDAQKACTLGNCKGLEYAKGRGDCL